MGHPLDGAAGSPVASGERACRCGRASSPTLGSTPETGKRHHDRIQPGLPLTPCREILHRATWYQRPPRRMASPANSKTLTALAWCRTPTNSWRSRSWVRQRVNKRSRASRHTCVTHLMLHRAPTHSELGHHAAVSPRGLDGTEIRRPHRPNIRLRRLQQVRSQNPQRVVFPHVHTAGAVRRQSGVDAKRRSAVPTEVGQPDGDSGRSARVSATPSRPPVSGHPDRKTARVRRLLGDPVEGDSPYRREGPGAAAARHARASV